MLRFKFRTYTQTLENRIDVLLVSYLGVSRPVDHTSDPFQAIWTDLAGLVFEIVAIPHDWAFPLLLHPAPYIIKAHIIWIDVPKRCICLQYTSPGCNALFGMQVFKMGKHNVAPA